MCHVVVHPRKQAEILDFVENLGTQEHYGIWMIFAYSKIKPEWSCPSVPCKKLETTEKIKTRIDHLVKSGQAVVREINLKQGRKGRLQRHFTATVICENLNLEV